jgi:hypothetical protein
MDQHAAKAVRFNALSLNDGLLQVSSSSRLSVPCSRPSLCWLDRAMEPAHPPPPRTQDVLAWLPPPSRAAAALVCRRFRTAVLATITHLELPMADLLADTHAGGRAAAPAHGRDAGPLLQRMSSKCRALDSLTLHLNTIMPAWQMEAQLAQLAGLRRLRDLKVLDAAYHRTQWSWQVLPPAACLLAGWLAGWLADLTTPARVRDPLSSSACGRPGNFRGGGRGRSWSQQAGTAPRPNGALWNGMDDAAPCRSSAS